MYARRDVYRVCFLEATAYLHVVYCRKLFSFSCDDLRSLTRVPETLSLLPLLSLSLFGRALSCLRPERGRKSVCSLRSFSEWLLFLCLRSSADHFCMQCARGCSNCHEVRKELFYWWRPGCNRGFSKGSIHFIPFCMMTPSPFLTVLKCPSSLGHRICDCFNPLPPLSRSLMVLSITRVRDG